MVAWETKFFLERTDKLRVQLQSLSLTDQTNMKLFLHSLVSTCNQFEESFIIQYSDKKTEIHVQSNILFYLDMYL